MPHVHPDWCGSVGWAFTHPSNQRSLVPYPEQGTRLASGCRPGPPTEGVGEATDGCFSHTSMFLSSFFPPPSLKINKILKKKESPCCY